MTTVKKAATVSGELRDLPQTDSLTTDQAAHMLNVSAAVMSSWRYKQAPDAPPYVKVGRNVRYRRADLEAWMASRTVGATSISH